MDRIETLLRRIRDPRACVELLLAAPGADAGKVAQQLAAVLSSLPAPLLLELASPVEGT